MKKICSLFFVLFLTPSHGDPLLPVECRNFSTGTVQNLFSAGFEEGVEDYIFHLRMPNYPGSLLAEFVGSKNVAAWEMEIRVPKLLKSPELQPGCFLTPKQRLLMNCTTGAVRAQARLTHLKTGEIKTVKIKSFKITSRREVHHFMGYGSDESENRFYWGYELAHGTRIYKGSFEFGICKEQP